MTRKTYEKKIRNFRYQLNQLPTTSKKVRDFRVKQPDFPFTPAFGKYAGIQIKSYSQTWDMLVDCMKDTPLGSKI